VAAPRIGTATTFGILGMIGIEERHFSEQHVGRTSYCNRTGLLRGTPKASAVGDLD